MQLFEVGDLGTFGNRQAGQEGKTHKGECTRIYLLLTEELDSRSWFLILMTGGGRNKQ